jgi:hypothetical protein
MEVLFPPTYPLEEMRSSRSLQYGSTRCPAWCVCHFLIRLCCNEAMINYFFFVVEIQSRLSHLFAHLSPDPPVSVSVSAFMMAIRCDRVLMNKFAAESVNNSKQDNSDVSHTTPSSKLYSNLLLLCLTAAFVVT